MTVKRMAVFVEHFPPYLGSDRSIFELARRTAERGVKVNFIATQPLRYLLGKRPANWKYKENWTRPPPKIHENVSATYFVLGRRMMSFWRHFYPLGYLLTIVLFIGYAVRQLIKFRPDVVVSAHASPIVGVVSFLSSHLLTIPYVMGVPDWMTAYAAELSKSRMDSFGPVLLQMVEIRLYRWADRVFAATEFLRKLLIGYGVRSERIVVIPNGVDPTLFSPSVDARDMEKKYRLENRHVVLFTGHLEEWAGVSLLYDLARQLDRDVEDSLLLLVGSGESANELFERLVGDGLGHMLTHAGYHPHEQMPKFNALADVALCIFPNTLVSHAASPLKLFEYMGSGVAIVATQVAGTQEVLDESTGILIRPGDAKGLCDAVTQLCLDRNARDRLGESARKLVVEKYTWSDLSDIFLKSCNEALRV